MSNSPTFNTPIALTVFNLPEETRRVFESIRNVRPKKLFLISDAPRTEEQRELVARTRAIVEQVDWECEVYKNYAETNMGAKMRLSSGIAWVFEHVERAIILEHDCLPEQSFYYFCQELLERYKDDERVMHISGDNFQQGNPHFVCEESYYFSVVPHIWGFATWRRAWTHYDVNVSLWPEAEKKGWLRNVFADDAVRERWEYRARQYYTREVTSWDGQWSFACFINNGLCINPRVNLVTNIGFVPGAAQLSDPTLPFANVPTQPIAFPLIHPKAILPNRDADAYVFKNIFYINLYLGQRVRWFFRSHFPNLYRIVKKFTAR